MASDGFSFPPPPPPPPVAASSVRPADAASRARARGRGGGGGSHGSASFGMGGTRGRGGNRGRGRGRGHQQQQFPQGRGWGPLPPSTDGLTTHPNLPQAVNGGAANHPSPVAHLPKRPHENALGPASSSQLRKAPLPSSSPAVPSFGYQPPSVPATTEPQEKRRKINQLGLTPSTTDYREASPKVGDEEAQLAQRTQLDGILEFNYRGKNASLSTPEDIAAWIEERRRRYPTAARIAAKEREEKERKQEASEAQTKRKEAAQQEKEKQTPTKGAATIVDESTTSNKDSTKEPGVAVNEGKPDETSATSKKSLIKASLARAGINEDELTAVSDDDGDSSTFDDSDTTDPDSEEDEEGDDRDGDSSDSSSSSSSSSDSGPETKTSRRLAPERVPPPIRKAPNSNPGPKDTPENANRRKSNRICRYFAKSGHCRNGLNCMFRHEMPMPRREKRSTQKGLYQIVSDSPHCMRSLTVMLMSSFSTLCSFLSNKKRPKTRKN